MDYYVVDAFTHGDFGGNAAGVVIYDSLSENIMQTVASELCFSETAFVKMISPQLFSIRYFTPNSEIELCGHATIASFKVLLSVGLVEKYRTYKIKTLSGRFSVHLYEDLIFMEAGTPEVSSVLEKYSIEQLCASIEIDPSELGDIRFNLKPQIVSTGLKDIILPVKSRVSLNRIKPDFKALTELSRNLGVVGVHAFTLDSTEFTAKCRNFAPLYGINEESATGTSNASLTYYLIKNDVIKDLNTTYVFSQGENMGKPSLIYAKMVENDGKIFVGGNVKIKKAACQTY